MNETEAAAAPGRARRRRGPWRFTGALRRVLHLSVIGPALFVASSTWAGAPVKIRIDGGAPSLDVGGEYLPPLGSAMVRVWLKPEMTGPMLSEARKAGEAGAHLHVIEPSRRGLAWTEDIRFYERRWISWIGITISIASSISR